MYSWTRYLSAMNKINKSKANPRSSKAWAKFPLLNLPVDTYRKGQIIRAVLGRQRSKHKINKHINSKFEDYGYRNDKGELISYDKFLTTYGQRDRNDKWKSYADRFKNIHILDNRWIVCPSQNSSNYDGLTVYYFKEGQRRLELINILGHANQIFQITSSGGESEIWSSGLPDKAMMDAYKIKPHEPDGQYFWNPDKDAYTRLSDVKIIMETAYRRFQLTRYSTAGYDPTEQKEIITQIWGQGDNKSMDWNQMESSQNKGFQKWVMGIFNSFENSEEVIIPPRTQWIINYHQYITNALKT